MPEVAELHPVGLRAPPTTRKGEVGGGRVGRESWGGRGSTSDSHHIHSYVCKQIRTL